MSMILAHHGPLTVELMADWARQTSGNSDEPPTWARRLKMLRPFTRYLQQFEPRTEVPDDADLRPRSASGWPHTSTASRRSSICWPRRVSWVPIPGLRGATYETLFGLIASHRSSCLRSRASAGSPMST